LTITGQYYEAYLSREGIGPAYPWTQHFDPVGSTFQVSVNASYVVDKTKMMYSAIIVPLPYDNVWVSNYGHCLVLTFNFDTELVTDPADYAVSLLFEMGFV
jgi:hypothetical protein